ncbi:MAG: 3-deoxy-D-manno-octulosonic acid kinase [Gammaproteobacteria bacterium]|nr:3-deoxy-D-manno-octulosonic acid kinase [Gammaproteobacteria bacterium]
MDSTETDSGRFHTRSREPLPTADARQLFDTAWLLEQGLVTHQSHSGRGTTAVFRYAGQSLVLRPYRRGGAVRHLSATKFIWTGLNRSRPWQEFDLLLAMRQLGLPCPNPFACQVVRHGLCYTGSLIMEEIAQAESLAQTLCQREISASEWSAVGRCIRHFHDASVYHSDLNANNILLDICGKIHLIDFDKSRFRSGQGNAWKLANLERLQRSILKCRMQADQFFYDPAQWSLLTAGYQEDPANDSR